MLKEGGEIMGQDSPMYLFLKSRRPDEFSDSIIKKQGKLSREFFDYYLNSLTSRSQEKEFEIFSRRLLEKEICPNLLPQTGPTGGGDSKVDSETYPVSESITTQALTFLKYFLDNHTTTCYNKIKTLWVVIV